MLIFFSLILVLSVRSWADCSIRWNLVWAKDKDEEGNHEAIAQGSSELHLQLTPKCLSLFPLEDSSWPYSMTHCVQVIFPAQFQHWCCPLQALQSVHRSTPHFYTWFLICLFYFSPRRGSASYLTGAHSVWMYVDSTVSVQILFFPVPQRHGALQIRCAAWRAVLSIYTPS